MVRGVGRASANCTPRVVRGVGGGMAGMKGSWVMGRGAIDMKDFDAMVLALVRQWRREGTKPPRDIVLAFPADEEAGGTKGAHWLVDEHADLFEGCTEAIGEVGGFSVSVSDDLRLY